MLKHTRLSSEARRANQVKENRRAQRELLSGTVGQLITSRAPAIFDGRLHGLAHVGRAYEELALTMCANYLATLSRDEQLRLSPEETPNGFKTTLRILQYAPRAYAEYCVSSARTAAKAEMVAGLTRSHATPNFFAVKPGDDGAVYEKAVGILHDAQAGKPPVTPFYFQPNDKGELFYLPDPQLVSIAAEDTQLRVNRGATAAPYEMCPAAGLFITTVWRRAVDFCADDPNIFAYDLNLALQEVGYSSSTKI